MKSVFFIPFNSLLGDVCDYSDQTREILAQKKHFVFGIALGNPISPYTNPLSLIRGEFLIKKSANHLILKPVMFFPFQRMDFIKRLNISINIFLINLFFLGDNRRKVLWFFEPTYNKLFVRFLKSNLSIYDCVDAFSYYEKLSAEHNYLLKNSDEMFVNSETLRELYLKQRDGVKVVPLGFYLKKKITFSKQLKNKSKSFCFVGAIGDRLDFKFIKKLVNKRKKDNFVFIGPMTFKNEKNKNQFLQLIENKRVNWFGKINKTDLLEKIKDFDFGLIPYKKTRFDINSFPMKVMEYFYLGMPVISTKIKELQRFEEHVFFPDEQGWNKLGLFLNKSAKNRSKKRKIALNNSWQKKVEKILSSLA